MNRDDDTVYLIRCELTKAVKIGVSRDPEGRLAMLQTACPGELVLLGTLRGGATKEAALHAQFASQRIRGEWFELDDIAVEIILRSLDVDLMFEAIRKTGHVQPELCFLTSEIVGFPVSIAWLGGQITESRRTEYQVMRWDERPGIGKEFWGWHLDNMKQCFPTPEAACVAFVASWKAWTRITRRTA